MSIINTTYGRAVLTVSEGGTSKNGGSLPALKGFISIPVENRQALAEAILNLPVKTDKKENEVVYLNLNCFANHSKRDGKLYQYSGDIQTSEKVEDEATAEQPSEVPA